MQQHNYSLRSNLSSANNYKLREIFATAAKQTAALAKKRLVKKQKEELETNRVTKITDKHTMLKQRQTQLQNEYQRAGVSVNRFSHLLQAPITVTGTLLQITEQLKHERQLIAVRKKILNTQRSKRNKAFNELNKLNRRILDACRTEDWYVNNRLYLEHEKNERKQRKHNDKLVTKTLFSSKLLNHRRMPEDMLWYEIRPRFMYETKVELIEAKYNPIKLLNRLSCSALKGFLKQAIRKPEYFALLTDTEKEKQIWRGSLRDYKPHFANLMKAQFIKQELINLMRTYKVVNPKAAYEMMRTFCILIDPKKKYKGYIVYPRLTSIPV